VPYEIESDVINFGSGLYCYPLIFKRKAHTRILNIKRFFITSIKCIHNFIRLITCYFIPLSLTKDTWKMRFSVINW